MVVEAQGSAAFAMVPRAQLPPEIQLAQRLAGNEQVTRDRAVKRLRKYIVARTQLAAGWRGVGGAGAPCGAGTLCGAGPGGGRRAARGRRRRWLSGVVVGPPNHVGPPRGQARARGSYEGASHSPIPCPRSPWRCLPSPPQFPGGRHPLLIVYPAFPATRCLGARSGICCCWQFSLRIISGLWSELYGSGGSAGTEDVLLVNWSL